jgi:hypothetical protein
MFTNFFGKVKSPCDDCLNGECTMNCSNRVLDDTPDEGTVFIERLEDGTVQLKVRSPGAHGYSFVNLSWQEWADLKSLDLPVPEVEPQF